jgi:HEAT repeat protein
VGEGRVRGLLQESPSRLRAEDLDGVFSAIQILALKDLAPEAEAFAADEKQELSVRVAAVRALITIGRPESILVLEKCAQSEDSRTLVQVAQLAMEALHRREGRGK